jgi:anti-sigma-K factor RskA
MNDVAFGPEAARDALAGEFVLGLLEGQAEAEAEQLMTSDADFARSVMVWRSHLNEIDATAKAEPVPADLWPGIEAAMNRTEAKVPAMVMGARPGPMSRLWESISFWRFGALGTGLAALVLAVGFGNLAQRAAVQPVLIAVLMTAENEAAAVVNVSADGRAELRPLKNFEVPPGKAIEIWTLWDRSVGPRSVGLVGSTQGVKLDLSKLPRQPGQLFEMTLEPATGSPTGRPTGPILTKGNASVPL